MAQVRSCLYHQSVRLLPSEEVEAAFDSLLYNDIPLNLIFYQIYIEVQLPTLLYHI